jgi:hypothetical protein
MKRMNATKVWVLGFAALLTIGCGSDDKPDTSTTTPTGTADAGDETTGEETTSEEETSTSDESPTTTEPNTGSTETPGDDLGEPVLEDVPPETELSDLDEDQLAEVCEAYVATATAVSVNLGQLCPAQGLFQAVQSDEVTDDESYQAACADRVAACEAEVTTAQEASPAERCESASTCGASVADFNACNLQIAALNSIVLEPLTEQEVPECSETTQSQANNVALSLGLQLTLGLAQVSNEAGGSPTDEDGPCARINEACPDLGVVLGAFSDLGASLN